MTDMPDPEDLVKNPSPTNCKLLVKALFDTWLTDGQAKIVYNIVFGSKRFAFVCPTRYGKTWAIAAALALYVTVFEGKTVTILSNKNDNCVKIRDRFIEHASQCPDLLQLLSSKSTGAKSLKEEISKREIKLSDGTHIQMQPAGNVGPDALDGLGGDLIVLDESDNVPDKNFEQGIRRMLGDNPDTRLVQSGNATLRNKHFYDAFKSDRYEAVRIDWEQAVTERYGPDGDRPLTREFVEGERQELPRSHFKAMYECEFPEDDENSLVAWRTLEAAQKRDVPPVLSATTPVPIDGSEAPPYILYGLDVAREGRDRSVLTRVVQYHGWYWATDQWVWDVADTQKLAKHVMARIQEMDGEDYTRVNVDSHGIGSGVLDRLREEHMYAVGVKVGVSSRSALRRPDDFQDLKAEKYDKVRQLFEDGNIFLGDGMHRETVSELDDLKVERNTRNKIRVVDPSKSPDFADSLMLAVAVDGPRTEGSTGSAKVF